MNRRVKVVEGEVENKKSENEWGERVEERGGLWEEDRWWNR